MESELVQPAMEAGEGYRIPSNRPSHAREFEPASSLGLKQFEAGDATEISEAGRITFHNTALESCVTERGS